MRLSARAAIRLWLFSLALLLIIAVPAAAFAGTLDGVVTDSSTGDPIEGAAIDAYLLPDYYDAWTFYSEAGGNYFFSLEDASYDVYASAPGYNGQYVGQVDLFGAQTLDISLDPAVLGLSGSVTDADTGDPLWGAVNLEYYDTIDETWYFWDWSNCEGSYAFYNLSEGTQYRVYTDIYGYDNLDNTFVYNGTPVTLDFQLTALPPSGVAGNVTDLDTGEPLWANLTLQYYDSMYGEWWDWDYAYAEPGAYVFPYMEEGYEYRILASAYGYESQVTDPFFYTPGIMLQYDFELSPQAPSVVGTITDASSGDPLYGDVYLEYYDADAAEWFACDGMWFEGTYQFYNLNLGTDYRVVTAVPDYVNQTSEPFVYNGDTVTVDFALDHAPAGVSGTITDASSGELLWGEVDLEAWNDDLGNWETVSWGWADEGSYIFFGLTEGTQYRVTTYVESYLSKSSDSFVYDGNRQYIDFALELAPVEAAGTITDADSGDPIDGDVVLYYWDDMDETWYESRYAWADMGQYEFRGLNAGTEYLVATAYEIYANQEAMPFVADGTLHQFDFQLTVAPIGVEGTVTDADTGEVLDGDVSLEYYDEGAGEWFTADWTWTDMGAYSFRNLVMGTDYRVTTHVRSYVNQTSDPFVYAGETVDRSFQLALGEVGVTGALTDADSGEPIFGEVSLQTYDSEFGDWWDIDYAYADEGTYAFRALVEGDEYRVMTSVNGYENQVSDSFVFDGMLQTVDFALTALPTGVTGTVTDSATGDPVDGYVDVEMWDPFLEEWDYSGVWADVNDGSYVVRGLEPGTEYRLNVYGWGYFPTVSDPFTFDGAPLVLDFALDPMPVSVGGDIIDASTGDPMEAEVKIEFYDADLDEWFTWDGGMFEGSYAWYELDPGTVFRLTATADGYVTEQTDEMVYEGDPITHDFVLAPEGWVPGITVEPIAGSSRYGTAIAASQQAFPEGAECVVIATGSNWPDALGGASLAAAKGGPILLTQQGALPADVLAEIRRLNATEAIVLGGEAAVGRPVFDALKAELGNANVTRIGGAGRYQTAELVAAATVEALGTDYDGTCFVATGGNFPDALGASPLAAAKGWPLFLAAPGGLSSSTLATMDEIGASKALILGGKAVVSDAVMGQLADYEPQRLAGGSRYETAKIVAEYGVANAGLGWNKVAIATGQNFPDALAGGVVQGLDGSVMLLTPSTTLDASARAALTANKADIHVVRFLGGTSAVSNAVRAQVQGILE